MKEEKRLMVGREEEEHGGEPIERNRNSKTMKAIKMVKGDNTGGDEERLRGGRGEGIW